MADTNQLTRLCTIISTVASVTAGLVLMIGFAIGGVWGGVVWVAIIVAAREFGRYYKVFYRSTKTLIANSAFVVFTILLPIGLILQLSPALLLGVMLANLIAWDSDALCTRMTEVTNSADVRLMLRRHYAILLAILLLSVLMFVALSNFNVVFSIWIAIAIAAVAVISLVLIARTLIQSWGKIS